ncbi:MAG: divergent polysaccharide deacetylase family protein, partial [Alphaproteobacteria bacterium]|nr:divergent polysaccharide deacetylase family protein [Alphaproteobacteria bacterium]
MKLTDVAAFDIFKRIGIDELKHSVLQGFDSKLFGLGLAVVSAVYFLIFSYVFLNANSTIASLEKHMNSYTLSFEDVSSHNFQINGPTYIVNPDEIKSGGHFLKGLGEETPFGILPIIRKEDGLTSFRAYQTPYNLSGITQKPVIAFIIKDFGLSIDTSQTALDLLPKEVGLALSPYAANPQNWIKKALEKKREIWTFIPVETADIKKIDTGPYTIMKRTGFDKSYKLFHRLIGSNTGTVGIASYSDPIMAQTDSALEAIISESYGRGLGYMDLNPDTPDFFENMALKNNAPYIIA